MNTAIKLGLATSLFVLLSGVSNAHAANTNFSGTVCKNYNAAEVTDIDYLVSGVRNLNANARYVICPLVRTPSTSTAGVTVYIDGYHSGAKTTSCTLYSYNYNGTFLGSASVTKTSTVAGAWEVSVSLPASKVATWSSLSMLCNIPGSASGLIYDLDVVQ